MYQNSCFKRSVLLFAFTGSLLLSYSQDRRQPPARPVTTPADTTKPRTLPVPPKAGPKPYKEIITSKAISSKGLFTVHKLDDKFFFEFGDSIMNRDILIVNRISKAPINTRAGFLGFAGDEINENVIRLERGPNNKIFLRNISFSVYAKDSAKPMYKTVTNSNIQPIAAAFDIKAYSADSAGVVLDMTDYISGDNDIFFFASSAKTALRVGVGQNCTARWRTSV
jgi:hypothetical protein